MKKEKIKFGLIFLLTSFLLNIFFVLLSFDGIDFPNTFIEIPYLTIGIFLNLIFLTILFNKNIFSYIFLFISSLFFGIDRYFAYLYKDKIFSYGLNDNNLDNLKNIKNSIQILKDYITHDSLEYILFYSIIFLIVFSISILYLKNKLKENDFKFEFNTKKQLLFISFFFLFITLTTNNYSQSPFQFRTYYITIKYFKNNFLMNDRSKIYFKNVNKTKIKNIILIMDESVQYEYFEKINDLKFNYIDLSPTLVTVNCSLGSNYDLITGLEDRKVENPSIIYQYAKSSGYKTFMMNTQSNTYSNGLNYKDKNYIDEFIYINDDLKSKDERLLDKTINILNEEGKKFIFLQKYGSHYNYKNTIMNKNKNSKTSKEKDYMDSIKENSIDFLNILNSKIDHSNTIVFYLSDHGQNKEFLTSSNLMISSHCDSNIYSYKVPSLIFGETELIKNNITKKKEYYSIDIFGLILINMGYDLKDIKKYYSVNTKENKYLKYKINGEINNY